jgi:hypothetical protein
VFDRLLSNHPALPDVDAQPRRDEPSVLGRQDRQLGGAAAQGVAGAAAQASKGTAASDGTRTPDSAVTRWTVSTCAVLAAGDAARGAVTAGEARVAPSSPGM